MEVFLKPGDVVVNCGTRHAWRNRSAQNCIAAFVCIGAKRQELEEENAEAVARRWVELYNDGTPTSYGSDRFLQLYAEDCAWTESPTKMYPQGRKGSLAQLRSGLAAGQAALVNRHVVFHEVVGDGPVGAMRYTWSATVNRDVPGYSKGDRIAFEIAAFLEVRQGRIVKIHELIVEQT